MWKLRDLISNEYLRACYFGLFQSHISYGLILWGHTYATQRILIIQKKVLRTMCRAASSQEHCRPLFAQTKILTVINLYIYQILIYAKTNIHLYNTRQDIHPHSTRNRCKLDIPQHRLAKFGTSHQVNIIKFFNKFPEKARDISLKRFKEKTLQWLQDNLFYTIREFLDCDVEVVF